MDDKMGGICGRYWRDEE